jgi:hypothetical protein
MTLRRTKIKKQQQLSLSTQAYKLFFKGKPPLEVAVTLDLGESEVTKFYKEYWKLKNLHNLNMVYKETKGDMESFLKLYRLSKVARINVQVINLL